MDRFGMTCLDVIFAVLRYIPWRECWKPKTVCTCMHVWGVGILRFGGEEDGKPQEEYFRI